MKFLMFLICILISFSGCSKAEAAPITGNDSYNIYINFDESTHSGEAKQTVSFINDYGVDISDICFNLYANTYKSINTAPAIGKAINNYPDGFDAGSIKINNVSINKKTLAYELNDSMLKVHLPDLLKTGKMITIDIDFTLKLPKATTRMSYYGGISQLTNWYPILAVYDNGWQVRTFNPIGESNYSDVANYTVTAIVDADTIIASTGEIIEEKNDNIKKSVAIKANDVRDFAMVMSKDFLIQETEYNGIKIKNYYREKNKYRGVDVNKYVKKVMAFYESAYGKYPYKTFSVVETYLKGGGMEYPTLITLGQNHYTDDYKLEHVVAHEMAHQWWYVTVGNDEYLEPFLDEGLADYSTNMYFKEKSSKPDKIPKIALRSKVDVFKSWADYNKIAYRLSAATISEMSNILGHDKFLVIMKEYYEIYKFKNASVDDLLYLVEKNSDDDMYKKIKQLWNR